MLQHNKQHKLKSHTVLTGYILMCNIVISVTEYMTDRKRVNTPCFQKTVHFCFYAFYLVLLTQHEVLHLLNVVFATHRTRSTAAWLPGNNCRPTSLSDSLQYNIDASKFPTTVGKLTQRPSCTTPL